MSATLLRGRHPRSIPIATGSQAAQWRHVIRSARPPIDTLDELRAYLARESRLPGPRGNLELADAFAALIEARVAAGDASAWPLSLALAAVTQDEAPTNDPGEFVAFCGVRGIGASGASDPATDC